MTTSCNVHGFEYFELSQGMPVQHDSVNEDDGAAWPRRSYVEGQVGLNFSQFSKDEHDEPINSHIQQTCHRKSVLLHTNRYSYSLKTATRGIYRREVLRWTGHADGAPPRRLDHGQNLLRFVGLDPEKWSHVFYRFFWLMCCMFGKLTCFLYMFNHVYYFNVDVLCWSNLIYTFLVWRSSIFNTSLHVASIHSFFGGACWIEQRRTTATVACGILQVLPYHTVELLRDDHPEVQKPGTQTGDQPKKLKHPTGITVSFFPTAFP